MKRYVIIVAGGSGTRIKSDRPKQFIEIDGVPVIIRSLRRFIEFDPEIIIIISVHRNYRSHLESIILKFGLEGKDIRVTIGGDTRYESVRNGIKLIDEEHAVVGIHDSARPFVSLQTIRNCFETAAQKGNAVPCVQVNESMRKISNNINSSVNRNEYKIIQTPQCFLSGIIREAFAQEYNPAFTDDATVVESAGGHIYLVEGNEENIKITSPHDLMVAKAILANEQ